ncbi:MAG: SDR family NAD(P)-dependent oxidoreductase, partial [Pirellulaceae bacterium]|nr:SDR family NAD(P)-dependent oxidoreductase [Pirellulaceae bacterium]
MLKTPPKTILVTGATGFIGAHLVQELTARGDRVRALSRTGGPHAENAAAGPAVEYLAGDVTDIDSLHRAVTGCDQVFHLAGYAKNWARDAGTFRRHNVGGLQNVLDAARAADVERVVWTSTVMTFGPTPPGVVCDETYDRSDTPCHTEYEKSKIAGERIAARYAREGLPVVTVNPTRVFGPGRLSEGNALSKI